jgi:hypothetical protein
MTEVGEPCAQCGSPLAADQRYCLNCGQRRGGPRIEYRQRIAGAEDSAGERMSLQDAPAPATEWESAPPAGPAKAERDYAPLAAVGGIAILGLMLLVGVLIGRGNGDAAPAPAPVVVQGSGAANASGEAGGGSGGGGLGAGSGGGTKKKNAKPGGPSETPAEAGAVTASEDQLEELQSETGEEAAKNALKLPDKIATPGKPPPIDKSKPPGGGEGGGVVIK